MQSSFFLTALYFWGLFSIVNALNLTLYERTCYSAVIPVFPSNSFCTFVTWNTGNMYPRKFFTMYSPGTALTVAARDTVARRYADTLRSVNDTSYTCRKAVTWLACSSVFPHCPVSTGSSSAVSFLEPCRFQCEQVNDACNFDLDCSVYPTSSCSFYVPPNYVVQAPTKGPYKRLPFTYAMIIALWGSSLVAWSGYAYLYQKYSVPKFVGLIGLIFLLRLATALVCRSFYIDCNEFLYICDSTVFGYTVPLLRLLEAVQFFAMLLLTRGIAMTRPSLLFSEYFCAIVSAFVFFAVSISVSAFIVQAPSLAWIVFTSIIYISLYAHFVALISMQIRNLRGISQKLTADMPQELIAPIHEKEFAFKVFFFLLLGFIGVEVCSQCMYAMEYISMETLVIAHEGPSWLLMAAMCWFFRPRKFSPYYFMLPADSLDVAALQEGQNRVLPVIIAHPNTPQQQQSRGLFGPRPAANPDAENMETEIELSPLLSAYDSWGYTPSQKRLVILQSPEGEVSVGLRGDGMGDSRARSLRGLFHR